MTSGRTYLDWNASAPMRPEAREAMLAVLEVTGNPSSVHAEGRRARAIVETAREAVARLVGAAPGEVYFTSGASEANAWALSLGWDTILLSALEHDSVTEPAARSGASVIDLPVGADGRLEAGAVDSAMGGVADRSGAGLVALQAANNETGVVQPVAEVAAAAAEHGLALLVDAVQAAGRTAIDFATLGADYLTLSAHKLGGPKGAGALVVRDGARLQPLVAGGGQERRQRAGTENVAAIAGFGAAAAVAAARRDEESVRVGALAARLEDGLLAATPEAVIVGRDAARLGNTTCVALPGRRAEVLVAALDLAGIAVSAGAACSSGKVAESRVLAAMGLDADLARGAIRVSLGPTTTGDDVTRFLEAWHVVAAPRRRAA